MKVLVLSPEKKDKESRERRSLIVRTLEDFKIKLLNPIPGRPPEKTVPYPSLFPQMFYKKQIALLEKADLVIADLTDPDFKIGFSISQALELKKPVLVLFWESIKREEIKDWEEEDLLFTDCFNSENVRSVLRHFIKFIKQRKKLRGKLIVIDGNDGSGKATQSEMLTKYLIKEGYQVKGADFPRYKSSFHGSVVGRYLKGDFGKLSEINPYLASLAYALDRLTAKSEIEDWLKNGNIVVSNRYTSSNMAFQTARVSQKEKKYFLNWLMDMEYKVHKLPKEDIVIFLYVPLKFNQELVLKKKKNREYVGKKKLDLHEKNLSFLREVEKMYLFLAKKFQNWVKIDCMDKEGKLLSPATIHEKVIKVLKKRKIINGEKK